MNFNLTNHKDATDRLNFQLKEVQAKIDLKDEENKLLQSKLAVFKLQMGKLEKMQMNEVSRSRSTSRRDASAFKFGENRP